MELEINEKLLDKITYYKSLPIFKFFPGVSEAFLAHSEIMNFPGEVTFIKEGEEAKGIYLSLDGRVRRALQVGQMNDQVHVSEIQPFHFIGISEIFDNKKFQTSYLTEEDTHFLFINRSFFTEAITEEVYKKRLRLLNSSPAIVRFCSFLLDQKMAMSDIESFLDTPQTSPLILEKRDQLQTQSNKIYFVQSGSILGKSKIDNEQKSFTIEEGDWFGPGFAIKPELREMRLTAQDTVFYRAMDISPVIKLCSTEVVAELEKEPCLFNEYVAPELEDQSKNSDFKVKILSISKTKYFNFVGDPKQLKFGSFPLSPFHSTLWNFLVLQGVEVNEKYVSQISRVHQRIRLSHMAANIEDFGFVTQLKKWGSKGGRQIPNKSILYFMGRPVLFLSQTQKRVFFIDPVYGLVSVRIKDFFSRWNRRLIEINNSPLQEAYGKDIKVIIEKPEVAGKKLIGLFLKKVSTELKNLMTFKIFQALVVLSVPTFLIGLVNQSLGRTSFKLIFVYYIGIILFLLYQAVSTYSLNYYNGRILSQFREKAQSYFYKLFLNSSSSANVQMRAGFISTRIGLFDFAFNAMKFEMMDLPLQMTLFALFIAIIWSFSWEAAIVLCIITAMAYFYVFYLRKKGGFTEVNTVVYRQEAIDSFVDIFNGLRSLRSSHAIKYAEDKMNSVVVNTARGVGEYTVGLTSITERGALIFKVGSVLVLYIVIKNLINHRASPTELFGLTIYLSYLNSPYMTISSYFTNYNTTGVFSFPGQLAKVDYIDKSKGHKNIKLYGALQLDHVSFRYSDRHPYSVVDCSFKVNEGELIAIVGRSGSGKSTLARLIARQVEPTIGKILYDEVDSRLIEASTVQNQIGFVPQLPSLFAGSLASNIAFAEDDFDIERIKEVAMATHAHQFIKRLPGDYHYQLKELGVGLSSGQKQMISLARVLYTNPQILVLDEVTAHLDPQSEGSVTEKIFEGKQRRTTFMIVHKISTARKADRILVLKHGRIIEEGDHNRLLAAGGEYSELYRHQVSGE